MKTVLADKKCASFTASGLMAKSGFDTRDSLLQAFHVLRPVQPESFDGRLRAFNVAMPQEASRAFLFTPSEERKLLINYFRGLKPDSAHIGEMLVSPDFIVREAACTYVGRHPDALASQFADLSPRLYAAFYRAPKDDDKLRLGLLAAMEASGEKALPLLRALSFGDYDKSTKDSIQATLTSVESGHIGQFQWRRQPEYLDSENRESFGELGRLQIAFLASTEPMLATPDQGSLVASVQAMADAVVAMRKATEGEFIGLFLHGSISKGYFTAGSDRDVAFLVKKTDSYARINQNLDLLPKGANAVAYVGVRSDNVADCSLCAEIFQGVYIGDRAMLRQIQWASLNNLSHDDWEYARRVMATWARDNRKLGRRFGVSTEALQELGAVQSLLQVPPPRDETLRLLKMGRSTSSRFAVSFE